MQRNAWAVGLGILAGVLVSQLMRRLDRTLLSVGGSEQPAS